MNNEPVAWIRQGEYGKPIIVQNPLHQFSYQAESAKWDDIPLYTHPAKTLTDGIDLLEKYADKLEDERPNKGLSDVVYECVAILRKA